MDHELRLLLTEAADLIHGELTDCSQCGEPLTLHDTGCIVGRLLAAAGAYKPSRVAPGEPDPRD